MSKYGKLTKREGNSKYFLQKTLLQHDSSMDHPWMQMIYNKSFETRQYAAWLALQRAAFVALERLVDRHADDTVLKPVHDPTLARTERLEADLAQLLQKDWREEADRMVAGSEATRLYLEHLEADLAAGGVEMLLAHHFLQYNAVLSGGAYLGKMVQEKFSLPFDAPGVRFYAFEGVGDGKGPARVQTYLRDMDTVEIDDDKRAQMLVAMKQVYADSEAMMTEIYQLSPGTGVSYGAAKDSDGKEAKPPVPFLESELVKLTLAELHGFMGADGGRILFSVDGELLDVSAARDIYGPGGSYSVLAGRDVTRCLATMSLEAAELDDLDWKPCADDDEKTLHRWCEKLKEKYPVAGYLLKDDGTVATSGLRKRNGAGTTSSSPSSRFYFTVVIDKKDGGKLGFDIDQDTLEIVGLAPAGLIADWNAKCDTVENKVQVHDRIEDVNDQCGMEGVFMELGSPQMLKIRLSRLVTAGTPSLDSTPAEVADGATQKCPISGKEGMACPMSMFLPSAPKKSEDAVAAAEKAHADPQAPGAKSSFMAGKSMLASVEKTSASSSSSWEDSFLYKLCPIHWDTQTIRVVACVAALSWASGFIVGWGLRKQFYQ
eukprot:TRINITY_DN51204_c0_g1_i1.p1 TRINITY_DN51204_c0_g1~~TRINITY_DN51204_c0_g1_i1.p1  ORF type:complete len:602 (+),score=137.89 TRINITY_DN51204_c0_g1_i1:84-1889(+)